MKTRFTDLHTRTALGLQMLPSIKEIFPHNWATSTHPPLPPSKESLDLPLHLAKWFKEDFLIGHSQTKTTWLVVRSAQNMEIVYMISHTSFLHSNNSLCPLVSEKIFLNFSHSETRIAFIWRSYLLTYQDKISNLYRGPSFDVSYQISVHLAVSEMKI